MGLVGETFGRSLSMGNHRTCRALASIATSKRLECRASSPGWREPGDRPNKAKTTAPCNVDEITKLSRLGAPGYSFRLLTLAPPRAIELGAVPSTLIFLYRKKRRHSSFRPLGLRKLGLFYIYGSA